MLFSAFIQIDQSGKAFKGIRNFSSQMIAIQRPDTQQNT